MKRSIEMACELISRDLLQASYLFGLVPYPGSELFQYPEKFGMRLLHRDYRFYHEDLPPVFDTNYASSEEIYEVFLAGVADLASAMSSDSEVLQLDRSTNSTYGNFWHSSHV